MTTTELVLNMLAETSTTDISKVEKPETFTENKKAARRGGRIAEGPAKLLKRRRASP